jgi:hypothetical protein
LAVAESTGFSNDLEGERASGPIPNTLNTCIVICRRAIVILGRQLRERARVSSLRGGPAAADGCDAAGQKIDFKKTKAERTAAGDPRAPLEERYGTQKKYVDMVTAASQGLLTDRLMPQEDAELYIKAAQSRHWDYPRTSDREASRTRQCRPARAGIAALRPTSRGLSCG